MQSPWRIELLGWLRAEMDGQAVTRFATHHTAALLARLALWPRRAHSREELAELLWPEVEFEAARARLRQALTSLRHQLEPPGVESGSVLIADRTHIRLNPAAISTDVAQFEALVRAGHLTDAISLYKGELLPGFYEEWVCDERDRLQARYEEIVEIVRDGEAAPQNTPTVPVKPSETTAREVVPETPRIRLPLQFTRFFGRDDEQARVSHLLQEHRLVTLTGPGGAGKTRLAIETARKQTGFGQIVFIGLADLSNGAHLTEALAEQMRLPRVEASRNTLDRLAEALAAQTTLLVLDNVEHLVAQAAPLVRTLLTRVPSLRLLVASRRRLQIAGEREFPVPPLPTPEEEAPPDAMAVCAAVQIFVDRAQTVRPDFQLTPRNARDVGVLCRYLEGSPLALELAAARASVLTPAQMLSRLSTRFELLATRRTDKDARHRSLWAAISWSVDLLPQPLRHFWRQLAVFRGGFTVEAAEAVTDETGAVEYLTQLRERSLVSVEESGAEMRFRLAESLREYAGEQSDAEETNATERLHGAYFLHLAQEGEEALRSSEEATWLTRLEVEHDNLRAALSSGFQRGDTSFTQNLVGALWGFWDRHGHLQEARYELERALTLPGPTQTPERAKVLNRLGAVLNNQGEFETAGRIHGETLALYEALNDPKGIALTWNRIAFIAHHQGHHAEARDAFLNAAARERELGNRFNLGAALVNLGILAQRLKSFAEAETYYAEALAQFEALAIPSGIADTLFNLAACQIAQAKFDVALPVLERASLLYETLNDRWSQAYVTLQRAEVARHEERWKEAERLLQEALLVFREVGDQKMIVPALRYLSNTACKSGDRSAAFRYLRDALRLAQSLGHRITYASCVEEAAFLMSEIGTMRARVQSAHLWGAAARLREKEAEENGALPALPVEPESAEVRSVRAVLGDENFRRAWESGHQLSDDETIVEALRVLEAA